MRPILLSAFSLFALTACIEPPGESPNTPGGAPGQPGEPGGVPGQPGEGPGAGGSDGPPPGEVPAWSTEVETDQDDFGDDAVSLSGEISCSEGSGPFYVYVMPPPPEEGDEPDEGPPVAVTSTEIEGPGAFTIKVPPAREVVVLGFEDADADEAPAEGGIFFHDDGAKLGTDSGTALSLDCLNLAPAPAGSEIPGDALEPGTLPEDLPPAPLEGGEGSPQPLDEGDPSDGAPDAAPPEGGPIDAPMPEEGTAPEGEDGG